MSKNSLTNEITDELMDYLYDNKLEIALDCPDDESIKDQCIEDYPEDLQKNPVREICLNCWRDYLGELKNENNKCIR